MSEPIEDLGETISRIIDLEPSENRMNKIELETAEVKTNEIESIKIKETTRNGLEELKIMKTNRKKELKK